MVGVLILTHGGLARELLAAAQKIGREVQQFEALTLDWGDSLEEVRKQVGQALDRLDQGDGVLVLTDVFGGTPSNVALGLRSAHHLEAVSGVNLPMVLSLTCRQGQDLPLTELAHWIRDKGRSSICSTENVGALAATG